MEDCLTSCASSYDLHSWQDAKRENVVSHCSDSVLLPLREAGWKPWKCFFSDRHESAFHVLACRIFFRDVHLTYQSLWRARNSYGCLLVLGTSTSWNLLVPLDFYWSPQKAGKKGHCGSGPHACGYKLNDSTHRLTVTHTQWHNKLPSL